MYHFCYLNKDNFIMSELPIYYYLFNIIFMHKYLNIQFEFILNKPIYKKLIHVFT